MIIAHGIDYYYNGSSFIARFLVFFANTVCFSVFLLVSGAVYYIAYLNNPDQWHFIATRLKNRLKLFLIAYWAVAIFGLIDKIIAADFSGRWIILLKIFTFQIMPSYTEFLIPFLAYGLIFLIFHKPLEKISQNWRLTLILATMCYLIGLLIYKIPTPSILVPWKALLAGHNNIFRFPIIQYSSLFLIGLNWGHWLVKNPHMHDRREKAQNLLIYLSSASIIVALVYVFTRNLGQLYHRWPPSIFFILLGLIAFFLFTFLIDKSYELKRHAFLRDSLLILGQNSFALYCTHIMLLKLFIFSQGAKVDSLIMIAGLIIILLIVSLALATFIPFNSSFNLTFIRENSGGPFSHYHDKNKPTIYQLADDVHHKPSFLTRLAFLSIAVILFVSTISFYGLNKEQIIQAKLPISQSWWNRDFAYHKTIKIKNLDNVSALKKSSIVSLSFNHQELVNEKKSLTGGGDLRIVYYDGNKYTELPTYNTNAMNITTSTINFSIQNDISPGRISNLYYLYYGNNLTDRVNDKSIASPSQVKAELTLEAEKSLTLVASVGKIWNLKSDGLTKAEPLSLNVKIADDSQAFDLLNYEVIGTNLRGQMTPVSDDYWETTIDADSLPPGTYRVRAYSDGDTKNFSQNTGFLVSYPLYVTWSYDWEGYNPPDSYLQAAARIANDHHIPISQYFNPRIYTAPDISPERRQYLTDWVKNRRDNYGDEIDLHLHMFPDFVSSAGITPKTSPKWAYNTDGYDILTTAYNYEEMLTMINHAKSLFEQNDLGMPAAYRAGAWFANGETLRAIADAGISIDSSGRTAYKFGPKKAAGFWDLASTTKPYLISSQNQNSSTPEPRLNLMEIPNNGADSYAFSAKDMIKRFTDNYNGSPLTEKQQITYLSHYQWLNIGEQKKLTDLFNYVDQFLNNKDLGPVKYVTTGQVYQAWVNK